MTTDRIVVSHFHTKKKMLERLGLLFGLVDTEATEYFRFDKSIFGKRASSKYTVSNKPSSFRSIIIVALIDAHTS